MGFDWQITNLVRLNLYMGVHSTNDITISYGPSIGACDKILNAHQLKRSCALNGDVPKKRGKDF
jgi:hypothetical protein